MRHLNFTRGLQCFLIMTLCLLTINVSAVNAQVVKLNQTLGNGVNVSDFQVSSNGAYTVYRALNESSGVANLFSVPTNRSKAPVRLNKVLPANARVQEYAISPDGKRVVYRANQDNVNRYELFSVPIEGGTSVKLNGAFASNCATCIVSEKFKISPNSLSVVYQANQEAADRNLLYIVPIAGGTVRKLNESLSTGVVYDEFEFTPDSSRVIFYYGATYQTRKLYGYPTTSGTAKLITAIVEQFSFRYKVSADSSRVVFVDDRDLNGQNELYGVAVTGGTRTPLSLSSEAVQDFAITSQCTLVVYSFENANATTNLTTVTIDGVNRYSVDTGKRISLFSLSPDGRAAVFQAQEGGYVEGLYSISVDTGATVRKLSSQTVPQYSYGVSSYKITPDSRRVIYASYQDNPYILELYSVPITGGSIVKLNNEASESDSGIYQYQPTADSQRVVFSFAFSDGRNLFINSVNGGAITSLSNEDVSEFVVTSDNRRVVFTRIAYFADGSFKIELYSANIAQ